MDRPIFANDIWCACYKKHWAKSKKFVIISLYMDFGFSTV